MHSSGEKAVTELSPSAIQSVDQLDGCNNVATIELWVVAIATHFQLIKT